MKKIPVWLIVLLVIALLIASKFIFFSKAGAKGPAAGKGAGNGPVSVNYFVVKPETFTNEIFTTGSVGALNQVDVLPEINGKVTGIYFKEGQKVAKGAPLVKLNDADLQAQLSKIRTQLKLSQQKLERVKKLLDVKGVSQEEYDMQENELLALKADEAYTIAQIAKTTIVAPFSGVVGLKDVSEGSFVSPAAPIVSLVQMQPLYVEFSVPEKYNAWLRNGLTISFASDNSETAKTHTASVYAIEPRVNQTTKTIKSRALYKGDQTFYPGSFVHVHVNLGQIRDAMMVPSQAVIPVLKGQNVFVSRNNLAVEVPVHIGVRTDETIQVTDGLKAGDTVITTGLMSVRKGSKLILIKQAD
jgi:membrane fusion protein, multidrug efflux system